MYAYIHRYIRKYIHTFIPSFIRSFIHSFIHTYIHVKVKAVLATYVFAQVRSYQFGGQFTVNGAIHLFVSIVATNVDVYYMVLQY
jgi:TctA family transporter